jgi:NADH:ubiquinone oxidoreductase subunit F (NADH-binding)
MSSPDLPLDEVRVWDPSVPGLVGDRPWHAQSYEDYSAAGGYSRLPAGGRSATEAMVEVESILASADLRGRGGAAFPTLVKLRSVAAAAREQGVPAAVVANGAEGEPLSYKDRYLMRYRPHTVLDGALLAAAAVGAEIVHIYVADVAAMAAMTAAIGELDVKRGEGPVLRPFTAQDTYVAGEETAAVRAINTGIARPTDKPPRPYQRGVGDAPTLVLNVETLAWLARAAMPGTPAADAFLATVSGAGLPPRLYELPTGLRLGEVVRDFTGRDSSRWNVVMGGFFGGILPVWPRLELSFDAVRDRGSSLGCGSLHLVDASVCPVKVVADVVSYFAEHNARQCRSCMSSSEGIAATLASMGRPSPGAGLESKLPRWSSVLRGTGACAVPDGVAVLLRTLLRHYPQVVSRHIDDGCPQCLAAPRERRWEHLSVAPPAEPAASAADFEPSYSLAGAL